MSDAVRDHVRGQLVGWSRFLAVLVVGVAVLDVVGWAAGVELLTRGLPTWPQMTPWSAALLALLALAILMQSSPLSQRWVSAGRGSAAVAGVLASVFLLEYLTGSAFGLDDLWFHDSVHALQDSWPGRPSPRTAVTVLLLSVGVVMTQLNRRWCYALWLVGLLTAATLPFVAAAGYLFNSLLLVGVTRSTGMGISTALAVLMLVVAAFMARPDRNPVSWIMARSDRRALVRMACILSGFPVLVGLSRLLMLALGMRDDAAWSLAVAVSTVLLGGVTFFLSQRVQRLLIEKERLRAEAEKRYRILADNAVDVVVHLQQGAVVHLQGSKVAWVSPSVQTGFGDPPEAWVGTDFGARVHPDDVETLVAALRRISPGHPTLTRVRVLTADGGYHWVDCHAKPYLDGDGNVDGVIAALRIVDDQVDAQRELERLARFDVLTGLVNRAETINRLEASITQPRSPGQYLGVLFCDVDHFKTVNDTWGHAAGDAVLSTLANRVRECLRAGDTAGRLGGDEMVVLLPGLHNLDEAVRIAEKIRVRAAEPMNYAGNTIHATLSIGATLVQAGDSTESITTRADEAMYEAKQAGRNRVTPIARCYQHRPPE